MVDLGYNIREIRIIGGVAGTSVTFSFAGGFILRRIGRYRSNDSILEVCISINTLYFMCLSYCTPTTLMLYIRDLFALEVMEWQPSLYIQQPWIAYRKDAEGTDLHYRPYYTSKRYVWLL